MKRPNLFLIGGPKCGTTSFQEWLSEHPQIFMSSPKEPCYFDKDLPWPDSPVTELDYLRLFEQADENHRIVGEASTNYLYSKVAVQNILTFNPAAKFVSMVRNPIDMAMSLHSYSVQQMTEDVTDFEAAWRLQDDRKMGRSLPALNYQPDFVLYGAFCSLGEQMRRLYSQVKKESVHVIVFEDLCREPEAVYRSCLTFLDLPYDGRSVYPVRNVTGAPKSPRVHRVLARLLAARQALPVPRLGLNVFSRLRRMNLQSARRTEISAEFRRELCDYFRGDVRLLSQLIGRDLEYWLSSEKGE